MKEITFDERKLIQLEMLDEIDSFCKVNKIRYSIAFGTLLGAIRHKGFIPWDDDVDIMMPLPDLLKFKKLFKSNKLTYVDVDVDTRHGFAFSRISYNNTINKEGLISKSYGICIDLYVMIGIPNDYTSFFKGLVPLFERRIQIMNIRSYLLKLFPLTNIPYYNTIQKKYRDYLFNKSVIYNKASTYYIIAGPLEIKEKMIYNRDLFKSIEPVKFEDREYMAITDWDYFLNLRYDDYMQLPPKSQRRPYHCGKYYWEK